MSKWQTLCLSVWMSSQDYLAAATETLPLLDPEETLSTSNRTSMPERDLFGELSHMLIVLGLMFAALLVLSWLSKRFLAYRMGAAETPGIIQVLERQTLSIKSTVYLLEVDGSRFLVGESPTELTLIGRLDFPGNSRNTTLASLQAATFDKKDSAT